MVVRPPDRYEFHDEKPLNIAENRTKFATSPGWSGHATGNGLKA
jgi:hypothetical protein